jgi:hypothetical protein
MGSFIDAKGRRHNEPVLKGRLNAQYLTEGFAAGVGMLLAGIGCMLLNQVMSSHVLPPVRLP